MKRTAEITSFFYKKPKITSTEPDAHYEVLDLPDVSSLQAQQGTKPDAHDAVSNLPDVCSQQAQEGTKLDEFVKVQGGQKNDIGQHIGGPKPSDSVLASIIQNHWEPPVGYKYPHSTHNKGGRIEKRFLKREHLDKYKWLALSPSQEGLFCKVCPFFAPARKGGHHGGMKLNALVTQPLKRFSKLLGKDGDLEKHNNAQYHQQALDRANDFLVAYKNPEKSIENQVDTYRMKRARENRKKLLYSLQNVLFLARQNIPFRGHRDEGSVFPKDFKQSNMGNFKELMRFRVEECGEKELAAQCCSESKRNSFLSKTVQNELIECCGEEIISQILQRMEENGLYSIGFDETTDISHKSQLTIFIRYVYQDKIREDFIGFINPRDPEKNLWKQSKHGEHEDSSQESSGSENEDEESPEAACDKNKSYDPRITGEKLGKTVLDVMRSLNLDLNKCIGVATDGCSVMTSEIVGAVSTIKKECRNAERVPCLNHSLNLSISKCSDVQSVRNSIGIVKEVVSFFKASPKRNAVLTKIVGKQLISVCETRWVERHLSITSFLNNIEKIMECLEEIANWSYFSRDNSSITAKTLLCAITNGEFIVTLICLADILSITMPLSKFFQKETIEVTKATEVLADTLTVLKMKRRNVDTEFSEIFNEAKKVGETLGSIIKTPRITSRQTNRPNAAGLSTAETYFKVNVFIPLLDSITNDVENRFSKEVLNLFKLNSLLPKSCSSSSASADSVIMDVEAFAKKYSSIIQAGEDGSDLLRNLKAEVKLWVAKWQRESASQSPLPSCAVESLEFCCPEIYPSIRSLLLILSSLPVSTATAERSFSTLKIIKTWLRNRCGQNRLTGLALMYVHRDIHINKEKVVDRYVNKGGKMRKNMFS